MEAAPSLSVRQIRDERIVPDCLFFTCDNYHNLRRNCEKKV